MFTNLHVKETLGFQIQLFKRQLMRSLMPIEFNVRQKSRNVEI